MKTHGSVRRVPKWGAKRSPRSAERQTGNKGRPRAQRILTDTDPIQDQLSDLFGLTTYAPRR